MKHIISNQAMLSTLKVSLNVDTVNEQTCIQATKELLPSVDSDDVSVDDDSDAVSVLT